MSAQQNVVLRSLGLGSIEGIGPDDALVNLARLAIFCTVVDCHSFARAADALAMSVANVSVHIRTLERLWGCPLFDRRRRGAQLTEAGHAAYEYATTVLRETVALRARLSDLAGGEAGVVTLGASSVQGTYILPAMLAEFHRQHPGARLRLLDLVPDQLGEAVARGEIDFAVASEVTPVYRGLRVERLWVDTMVILAPPHHPLAQRGRLTLADIASQEFVTGRIRTLGDQMLDAALAQAGFPPRRSVMLVASHEAQKQMALQGVGLVILFRRNAAEELATGRLVELSVEGLDMTEECRLLYRATHHFSPLARRLMDFIRAQAPRIATERQGPATS